VSAYRDADGPLLIIRAQDDQVTAIDAVTGNLAWNVQLDSPRGPISLHVDPKRVVALGSAELAVIGYADGKVLHSIRIGGSTLLVHGERAYVSEREALTAVDLASGHVLWSQRTRAAGVHAASLGTPSGCVQGIDRRR
jgi:outer membrane protein assembly factor BamB